MVAMKGPKSILYKHNHVPYKIKGNEVGGGGGGVGGMSGITRGQKVGFWVLFVTSTLTG